MIMNFILNFFSQILIFKIFVVTKPLTPGILFSTSLIFVFKTVAVTKPLIPGIFFINILNLLSLNFVYLCLLIYVN